MVCVVADNLSFDEYARLFHLLGQMSEDLRQHMYWFYRVSTADHDAIINVAYWSRLYDCPCYRAIDASDVARPTLISFRREMERLAAGVALDDIAVVVVTQ